MVTDSTLKWILIDIGKVLRFATINNTLETRKTLFF